MPLVSRTIPNLVQGVSQQPEVLRLSSQATSQINGFSSVVEGLKKRPPTNFIAKLSSSSFGNCFVHCCHLDHILNNLCTFGSCSSTVGWSRREGNYLLLNKYWEEYFYTF